MLMPKKTKYRKYHRGRNKGKAGAGAKVSFGEFGLQTLENCPINSRQIEAARKAMTRQVARGGKIWIRIFPDHVLTARPADTRMGKGKGSPVEWVAKVRAGKILFEMAGIDAVLAEEAMTLAAHKLPCKTRFVNTLKKR